MNQKRYEVRTYDHGWHDMATGEPRHVSTYGCYSSLQAACAAFEGEEIRREINFLGGAVAPRVYDLRTGEILAEDDIGEQSM